MLRILYLFSLVLLLLSCCFILPAAYAVSETEALLRLATQNLKAGHFSEAHVQFESLAMQGCAEAQFELGRMLYSGDGVPTDYQAGVRWLKEASSQNHADAQAFLGIAYKYGYGVVKNSRKSVELFRLAAKNHSVAALQLLGDAYHDGDGVQKDLTQAYAYYLAAKYFKHDEDQELRKRVIMLAASLTAESQQRGQDLATNIVDSWSSSNQLSPTTELYHFQLQSFEGNVVDCTLILIQSNHVFCRVDGKKRRFRQSDVRFITLFHGSVAEERYDLGKLSNSKSTQIFSRLNQLSADNLKQQKPKPRPSKIRRVNDDALEVKRVMYQQCRSRNYARCSTECAVNAYEASRSCTLSCLSQACADR